VRQRFGFSLPPVLAILLYAATLVLELPVILTRMLIAAASVALLLLFFTHAAPGWADYAKLGAIPTFWAIFAFADPVGGGWWWRQNMGGRLPSGREQLAYADARELLASYTSERLPMPDWFVIDTPQLDAAVNGTTLMLSRGLLESDHLPAVVAHELGHLASTDGRLTAAINRLIIHPPPRPADADEELRERHGWDIAFLLSPEGLVLTLLGVRVFLWVVRRIISFAKGGLGLRLTAPVWGVYWRGREYTADEFAAQLGQADELADFLEIHALIHDHPVPFIWLTEHTHPPTELRVDRLRNFAHAPVGARLLSANGHGPDQPQMLTP
jgi:Zn-dependent protease with chaperone function